MFDRQLILRPNRTLDFEIIVALKVDGAKETQLMEKLEVEGLPTTVIVSPDGKELNRIVGYVTPEKMQKALEQSVARGQAVSSSRYR